uniref:Uncharacterized protein n=1 Tax=Anguilla anguilla TaxID=7936 RepID=A0A0E9SGV7_ANGAN
MHWARGRNTPWNSANLSQGSIMYSHDLNVILSINTCNYKTTRYNVISHSPQ